MLYFAQACTLYNGALEQYTTVASHQTWITVYKETGKGINFVDQCKVFRDKRNNNSDIYGLLNATSVQQMLRRLDKAYSAFFSQDEGRRNTRLPKI